jgi:transcription antitermination factor NusG
MSELHTTLSDTATSLAILPQALESHWYAAYTSANHEKSVAKQMEARALECFLPLYGKMSRWKDRRVKLQRPLFPGYVFVHIELQERLRVLQIPGVVRLVGFNGVPTPLRDQEIDVMRSALTAGVYAEPCPFLQVGRRVRLRSGPLQGLEGILLKKKGGCRFVLSLELIQRSVSVEVDAADVSN